jgi:hypothetical protein
VPADKARQRQPELGSVLEEAVTNAKRAALDPQDPRCLRGLSSPDARLSELGRLTVGQVHQQNALAAIGQLGQGAAHLRLSVIRMGGDDQRVVRH